MVVWNESNEIELSSDGDDTLKKFLHYRRNSLLSYPNDNAQLLTKEQFEGGVVGKCIIYWSYSYICVYQVQKLCQCIELQQTCVLRELSWI